MIERSRVRIPAGNGGRIFLLQGRLSVLTLIFGIRSTPRVTAVARKKIPGHSAKKVAGGQVTAKTRIHLTYVDFTEPCFGIGHSLSLICQMTSEDIKHQLIIISCLHTDRSRKHSLAFIPPPSLQNVTVCHGALPFFTYIDDLWSAPLRYVNILLMECSPSLHVSTICGVCRTLCKSTVNGMFSFFTYIDDLWSMPYFM